MSNIELNIYFKSSVLYPILDSIVVSIPACHAGDRGSIPRRGDFLKILCHNSCYKNLL